jgi:predicted nucleic-acid-binding protein
MIALDTNVLVRFLVEDDRAQSAAAAALIERAISEDESLFVSDVALCEVVWVLEFSYKVPRPEVHTALRGLLHARHLAFADAAVLTRALAAFAAGKGDFADYVIREHGLAAGATSVATFDRALLKEPGFTRP